MIVPIIAGFALGTIIANSRKPHRDNRSVGHHSPTAGHPRDGASTYYLLLFARMKQMGKEPSEALTNAAIEEAMALGDWETADALTQYAFEKHPSIEGSAPGPTEEESPTVTEEPNALDMKSPFDGASDDDWRDFITALQTETPDYKSENHVGAFHHHKKRLSQLGIDDVSTLEKQYQAIVADILDNKEKGDSLIKRYTAEPITVKGQEHVITASGVLGLMKSAGPKGAAAWLENPADREKYAKTTESFLRCNGCF